MASSALSHLPADLFLSRDVFGTVLTDGWHQISDHKKNELLGKFLPDSLDHQERGSSVQMLLKDDLTRFGVNPVDSLYVQLRIGRLAPDISKTIEDVKRLKRTAQKLKENENQIILWKEILSRRKQAFENSVHCSPEELASSACDRTRSKRKSCPETQYSSSSPIISIKSLRMTDDIRSKADRRFKQELKELNSMTVITSEDDEDLTLENDVKDNLSDDDSIDCTSNLNGLKKDRNKADDLRIRELITEFRKSRRKEGKIVSTTCASFQVNGTVNGSWNEQLNEIISRVGGVAEDVIILTSPPLPPINAKKKRKTNCTARRKQPSKVQSLTTKLVKKESFSPVVDSKPILPGIELMSRKLDLNLNSLKKENKSVDVFDFDDDSPTESLATPAIPVPVANAAPSSTIFSQQTSAAIVKTESVTPPLVQNSLQHVLQQIQLHAPSQPVSQSVIPVSIAQPMLLPTKVTQQLAATVKQYQTTDQQLQTQSEIANHVSNHIAPQHQQQSHQIQATIQGTTHLHHSQIQPQNHVQTYVQSIPTHGTLLPQLHASQCLNDSLTQPVVQQCHAKTKTPPPVVYEDSPPPSFFSLIRDIFKSHSYPDFKLTLHKLEELVKDRLRTINPSLGWNHESVQSAMNFLSYFTDSNPDVESIPLVDYKEKNQQWQWIGQGRDSDEVLSFMCKEWLSEKDRYSSVVDPSQPVPPAAWPTEWTVKPSTEDERKVYREQEAVRYNNPNKAFTYRIHSYESVVGPVKGCGVGVTVTAPPMQSPNKAREHSLLVSDRPPFVTLLSLVRDAAARLPNGEGTRADICELLKDSQYLLSTVSDQQINSIVSGALDRLHYEKDPCVKYDVNRKVWIYLHRNRSEGDFERLHEMQIAAAKAKKNLTKKGRPNKPLVSPPAISSPKNIQQKKPLVDNSIVSPITHSGQTRISISPLISQESTDKTIMNILNQAQGTGPPIFPKKKPIKEVQIVHNICTLDDDASVTSTVASVVRPITANNVVSMIPVSTMPTGNRPIASADSRNKVQQFIHQNNSPVSLQPLQKLSSKSAISVLTARPQQAIAANNDSKRTVTVNLPNSHSDSKVQQPVLRQVVSQQVTAQQIAAQPMTGQQTVSIQPAAQQTTQISIPSSMIFGGRHGQVMLGGKSYTMTSQNGGQLVLQPSHTSGTITTSQGSIVSAGQPLRLQGIKVISVPSNGPRVLMPQQGQPVMARIVARPGLPTLQPVILASTQTTVPTTQNQVVHHVASHQQLVSIQPQVQPAIQPANK